MSIEYLPVGIACNIGCTYCYQDPMRDAGNVTTPVDWTAAREQLLKENWKFQVFGGEPLLASIEHLEEVFKFGYETFGERVKKEGESANGIQTNGILITDAHIKLFRQYDVGVGISVDGPGALNDARRVGDLHRTRESTNKTHSAIRKLCAAGIIPGIIVTIHKINADSDEKLELLCAWFSELEALGVRDINLHILEVECGKEELALTDEENIQAFGRFFEFSKISKIGFSPFKDIRRMLLQEELNKLACIWNSCDPLTTDAVHGVTPDGTQSNCGRTNKDGINWVKGDKPGFERYLLLHSTPFEHGGCRDCRFFVFCKGQCPGTAIDGDWRNRTVNCKVWYALFEMVERQILSECRLPVTREATRLREIEATLVDRWRTGFSGDGSQHADAHGDVPHGDAPHGDAHGDIPHGDSHGDSNNPIIEVKGVAVTWI